MSHDHNLKNSAKKALRDSMDLAAAQARLAQDGGQRLWRSFDELSDTAQYRDAVEHEFPAGADTAPEGVNRRDVLKLAAASVAVAGLSACTKLPTQKIVPYVRPPEEIIPGKPLFYATSMPAGGEATGLLVESHMGRPTKIEGNPSHPGSLGATDVFAQASILNLYDPDRSQAITFQGRVSSWGDFAAEMGNRRWRLGPNGAGLRILTRTVTSPTLAAQMRALLAQFPAAKWHQYEPVTGDAAREGTRLAFGKPLNPVYRVDQADVIVSLDADFLSSGTGHVRYAREFASRRDLAAGPSAKLNRLYVVESMPTSTGAMSDHRLAVRSSDVENFARRLAAAVGTSVSAPAGASSAKIPANWLAAVGRDLGEHRGASLVIAGEHQPAVVHALAHAMNVALDNVGKTVVYTDPLDASPVSQTESLRELVDDLNSNHVELLLILGTNPLYDAPADFDFGTAMGKAPLRVHSGLYNDETAEYCHWHVPAAHYLEFWSDARAYDGSAGIVQPLIAPLYDGHSAHEIISALTGDAGKSGYDLVRDFWRTQRAEKDRAFETLWETSLHDGVIAGTALPAVSVSLRPDFASQLPAPSAPASESALEIVFRPDPTLGDGEFANNAWLQETPKPITRLTWDNAAIIGPATAQKLGLTSGDYVNLKLAGRSVKAGVFVVPGHADNSVTLHLGYGRRRAGKVGNYAGFNANFLRTSSAPWMATGLEIEKTGEKYGFATTQSQNAIDYEGRKEDEESGEAFSRELVQIATLEEFRKDPNFAKVPETTEDKSLSIYPGYKYDGYSWGMSIDLNRCVGCNACVVACQSENNIPAVGKEQVMRGRAMHWIRIDTYFRGGLENPEMYYEPLPCMQCENAPCEYVCPVGATTHSPEGLNDMTYNRCVGTRYCLNNCPYKVRRFNFFLFSDYETPSLKAMRNPNVTVRSRGVMEKCTYCVQRIQEAKIRSEEQDRSIRDGEILTACQQVCPAEAIVFGNINDPNSKVSKLKAQSRDYVLLADLNTRPRTSFLARVRNPNPEIHD